MRSKLIRISFFVLLFGGLGLAFLGSPPPAALAQEATPSDDEVNAIAQELFCPVCENTPLDVCPTEACRQWRDLIRQMLAEGRSEDEITQYFVQNYGARVLAEPPARGFNWLVYLLPPAVFIALAFLLARAFHAWRGRAMLPNPASPSEAAASPRSGKKAVGREDAYVARLEEELKKRK